jgi:hypothetical protein
MACLGDQESLNQLVPCYVTHIGIWVRIKWPDSSWWQNSKLHWDSIRSSLRSRRIHLMMSWITYAQNIDITIWTTLSHRNCIVADMRKKPAIILWLFEFFVPHTGVGQTEVDGPCVPEGSDRAFHQNIWTVLRWRQKGYLEMTWRQGRLCPLMVSEHFERPRTRSVPLDDWLQKNGLTILSSRICR